MGEVIRRKNGRLYLRYYEKSGKRCMRAATGATSYSQARKMLLRIEADIASGACRPVESERLTVSELCERFIKAAHPLAKDVTRYRRQVGFGLRPLLPLLGHIPLAKLKRQDIEAARDKLSAAYKPNSVRYYLAPLSSVLSWAVRQELIAANPMQKLAMPRRQNSTDRLTAEQASRLLAVAKASALACSGRRRPLHYSLFIVVSLALRLGLRKGECFGLRWADVLFDRGVINVTRQLDTTQARTAAGSHRSPKSGKPRTLPIPPALAEELRAWQAECPQTPAGLVCPLGSTAIGSLNELLQAADCPRFNRPLHSLRHTFASLILENGGSILAVKDALGHSSLDVTLIYSHLAPGALAADVGKIKL